MPRVRLPEPVLPIAAHLPAYASVGPCWRSAPAGAFFIFSMGSAPPRELESLAQPNDLRCEPLAARRRRDLAPIELGGGPICRKVRKLSQDRP